MDDLEKAYKSSLHFLSFRPRSEKEIINHLLHRGFEEKITEQVITKLKSSGFIDDREFIKWWIDQRISFNPRSRRLIIAEIEAKGINRELIKEMLETIAVGLPEDMDLAKTLITQKSFKKDQKKIKNLLMLRGFDWETIKRIIDGL